MNFEKNVEKIEEILKKLEDGSVSLEESLKLFEDGVKLTKECLDRLDEYRGKFEVIKNKIGE